MAAAGTFGSSGGTGGAAGAGESAGAGTTGGSAAGGTAAAGSSAGQAAQPVQIPSDAVRYVVQDGETLYGICMERYHNLRRLAEICQWNQLEDENRLSVGQELYLPPAD